MLLRLIAIIAWGLAAGCASAQETPPAPARIIAIGDLHGDYQAFESLMLDAGLIDARGRWAGGETIFVQTGDVPDRGPDSLKIINHLRKLQKQAPRKGGRVVTLVGNHEAMNMTGDLRYVHPGEYSAFANRNSKRVRERVYQASRDNIEAFYLERDPSLTSEDIKAQWIEDTPLGKIEHQTAWRPDGDVGEWEAANPAVAIVGDSLFVHGGVSAKYVSFSLNEINGDVAKALAERNTDPDSIINDVAGPLWYRGLIVRTGDNVIGAGDTPTQLSIEDEIDLVLNRFGVARIVVGHTPSLTGITAHHNGRLIQIDTGIAAYYGGAKSFLEIKNGALYAHDNGVVTALDGGATGSGN
jgi:calcineurin-like phosphoesterase family protein